MSTKPNMTLADIFWKLDSLADSTVLSDEASTAARDAARALREAARSLGVDPAHGADSIVAAIESLQERYRQARHQAGAAHMPIDRPQADAGGLSHDGG